MTSHVEALFTHDAAFRLQGVNEPWANQADDVPAPRFFLGRTGAGNIWRFRADLPTPLVEQLEGLCVNEPVTPNLSERPKYFEAYMRLLEAHHPIRHVWQGPAYHVVVRQARVSGSCVQITTTNAEILGVGFANSGRNWIQPNPSLALSGKGVSSLFVGVFVSAPEGMKPG